MTTRSLPANVGKSPLITTVGVERSHRRPALMAMHCRVEPGNSGTFAVILNELLAFVVLFPGLEETRVSHFRAGQWAVVCKFCHAAARQQFTSSPEYRRYLRLWRNLAACAVGDRL